MLISPQHRARYRAYYAARPSVPPVIPAWLPLLAALVVEVGATSVLDYGCGPAAALSHAASFPVRNYDPGELAYARTPGLADVVVCTHTLEHVEPACLADVLAHLWDCAWLAAFVLVQCDISTKVLPDGTPWHTCVHPPDWWAERLATLPEARIVVLSAPGVARPGREFLCVLYRGGL